MKYFNEIINELKLTNENVISGEKVFYLYDSLGFPIDLTQLMAIEKGFTIDINGFQIAMEEQKNRGRIATRSKKLENIDQLQLAAEQISYLQKLNIKPTNDQLKYEDTISYQSNIQAIYTKNGFLNQFTSNDLIDENNHFKTIGIILDKTSFYAESGGQVADTGSIELNLNNEKIIFDVLDVQVFGGYILHICILSDENKSQITSNNKNILETIHNLPVIIEIDSIKRRKVAPNHTMTHILNFILRDVLKTSIEQKGSQVTDEKLRFDFNFNRVITLNEISLIENKINELINNNYIVSNKVLSLNDAKLINGLQAVFGEVYPDPVRVISVGANVSFIILE